MTTLTSLEYSHPHFPSFAKDLACLPLWSWPCQCRRLPKYGPSLVRHRQHRQLCHPRGLDRGKFAAWPRVQHRIHKRCPKSRLQVAQVLRALRARARGRQGVPLKVARGLRGTYWAGPQERAFTRHSQWGQAPRHPLATAMRPRPTPSLSIALRARTAQQQLYWRGSCVTSRCRCVTRSHFSTPEDPSSDRTCPSALPFSSSRRGSMAPHPSRCARWSPRCATPLSVSGMWSRTLSSTRLGRRLMSRAKLKRCFRQRLRLSSSPECPEALVTEE
mmetsp:Transcript_14601/g.39327  ORF Transcript_14601/g.39327 Transcript_14601/m.39327 type:complete len:274 (-) Transcript_14601:200-1021(-)